MARGGGYHAMSRREKIEYSQRLRRSGRMGTPLLGEARVLFRCRLCAVQVTANDRQGHVDRNHRGGDVLVVFKVVK